MPQGRSVVGFIGLGDNDGRGMSHMRALPLCAVLATLLYFGQAAAQQPDWPGSKPIRFEVTAAAGGLPDIVPRTLSTFISTSAGVPVIVENRPGAGGNIAAAMVAKAAPDGHALLVTGPNQAVNPTLLPNPGFDYERDLTPVSMVVQTKMLLVASPGFPGNDIADIIRLAKEKPKSLSIAISAIGTPNHLGAEMLTQFGNIDLVFVPYDGISQAIPDLIANRVERSPHSQPCYRRSKPARSKPWPLPRRNARRSRRRFRQPQRRDCRRCRSMHGSVSWAPAARRRPSSPASTLKSPRLWRCPNYAKPSPSRASIFST